MENDMAQLIATCEKLCDNLSKMAENERKFGWDLCHRIEQLSYDVYKCSEEMRQISYYTVCDSQRQVI
jgi:hypothetical protein